MASEKLKRILSERKKQRSVSRRKKVASEKRKRISLEGRQRSDSRRKISRRKLALNKYMQTGKRKEKKQGSRRIRSSRDSSSGNIKRSISRSPRSKNMNLSKSMSLSSDMKSSL
jgi:hypothetical protein